MEPPPPTVQEHHELQECPRRLVHCPLKCTEMVIFEELDRHLTEECVKRPAKPCTCRLGCDALDAAGIAWTPRHTCTSLVGIRAALRAGLGVTARGVEQLDPGLRVLGAGDGMPPLPDLAYRLYIRSHVISPVTRQIFENLQARMRQPAG